MTILNQCKAQDPATCRYHHPNAGAEAFSAWKEAEKKIDVAKKAIARGDESGHADFMNARYEADRAEETYYGTGDGLIYLHLKRDETTDPVEKYALDTLIVTAKYHVREQEHANEIDNKAGGPLIPARISHSYTPAFITEGGSPLWKEHTGSNYDSKLTNVVIKSRISSDIKEAQKKGYLPKHVQMKLSTRDGHINVRIVGVPNEQIYNDPETQRLSDLTPNARELKQRISTIVNSYNRTQQDEIEGRRNMTNFWENIDYETDWERERREARSR